MTDKQCSQQPRPMRVLLVDDDQDMLVLLHATVEDRLGPLVQVDSAADPKDAREKLDVSVVDVLVTDLEMPGINGLQLLRHAKRRNAWTQVVVLTGHSGMDALTAAMDLGASDYLVKPVDVDELEQSLREACARLHRWRRSAGRTFAHGDSHPGTIATLAALVPN